MRKVVVVICGIILLCNSVHAQSAYIEQPLLDWLAEASPSDQVPIKLMLEDRVDIKALKDGFTENGVPVSERPRLVMRALKDKAGETQKDILDFLSETEEDYTDLRTYWINNSLYLKANKDLILAIADFPGVEFMNVATEVASIPDPKKGAGQAKSEGGIEPGLAAINAPELWAMGYTGHGRKAMSYDTGVSADHPAFSDRFLANLLPLQTTWLGFDTDFPFDRDGHGTHISGTMLGLDEATADTIGVAPRAYFIATDELESSQGDGPEVVFQWAMNPDGDENTSDDVPDVINNSWGVDPPGFCEPLAAALSLAIEAAGIANVFAAGNEGPNPETLGFVASINVGLVNTFTVGAVNGSSPNFTIADFSSRGPSGCEAEGSLYIKPEVSAPGVNVRSAYPDGEYEFLSGTSMAAPHASGAVLLLKEAYPMASGEELLMALYLTAIDLGEEGEDNTYGNGLIDVKAAFDYLAETFTPVPPQELIADIQITEIVSPNAEFACPEPGENSIIPIIKVQNNGLEAIQDFTIRYNINGGTEEVYTATAPLEAGEEQELELSSISYSDEGIIELHVKIDEIENEYDSYNNNRIHRWNEISASPIPAFDFTEDFDNGINLDEWTVFNPDGDLTWQTLNVIQADGTNGQAAWMNHPDYVLIESQKDYLVSPRFDFSEPNGAWGISYDYFYRKRNSSSFQQDTFAVYLNEICLDGLESIELLRKAGEDLYTNPDAQSDALPASITDWGTEFIAIPDEIDLNSTYFFSFVTRNRRGNNFLIDNINLSQVSSTSIRNTAEFELFPNPAKGSFTVSTGDESMIQEISVFDLAGRQLERILVNAPNIQLDQGNLANGVYIVQIELASGETGSKRLIIQ